MFVKKGDKIKVNYTGKLEDGTVFDSTQHGDHSHPIEFVVGSGQIIKGFDNAVMGMKKGDKKNISLKPEEAYGEQRADMHKKIPRDQIPQDQEPKKGMVLVLNFNGGQIPAEIIAVDEESVTIDLNHPLAGKTLNFELEIVEIGSNNKNQNGRKTNKKH